MHLTLMQTFKETHFYEVIKIFLSRLRLETPKQASEETLRLPGLEPLHQPLEPIVGPQSGQVGVRSALFEVLVSSLQAPCGSCVP